MTATNRGWRLYEELTAGRLSRREFVVRATALGMAMPVAAFAVRALAAASDAAATTRPAAGTEQQRRGAGGELKILQWQAPTHASNHTSNGAKDTLAAALVSEPLMNYLPDATPVPTLVREVPSVDNGLLAPDLRTVTYRLLPGVVWSDGAPLTARDVVFTWGWIMDPANGATTAAVYEPLANAEALDDLTVRLTFKQPTLAWANPFSGTWRGSIYPEHVLAKGSGAHDAFRTKPIGTGPYVVESFKENDQVTYVVNENYREPNKPFFARVNLKGGGDAASAAQAVLQTGGWDLAWNLQVEPDLLKEMEKGGKGRKVTAPGSYVERVLFNFSDPDKEVAGQRSYWRQPHPFLGDPAVRRAMTLATDRQAIAEQFYDGPPGEPPAGNIVTGIPAYESPNTSWLFDPDLAGRVLDEGGWAMDGGVRKKGDIALKVTYATSINAVRQNTQAVNQKTWEGLGIAVRLKQVDAASFFDSAPGNDQNALHFYTDLQMYTDGASTPFPTAHMALWYSNDGANIAQKENGWSRPNDSRYHNPAYDALYEAALVETDPERAAALFIRMNDLLLDDFVVIPLVRRAADKYGIANTLREENIAASPWECLYWNVANWNRTSDETAAVRTRHRA
jgi:peptide/nickel transport system substrate-binding protein